jgi:hypothetical protein
MAHPDDPQGHGYMGRPAVTVEELRRARLPMENDERKPLPDPPAFTVSRPWVNPI